MSQPYRCPVCNGVGNVPEGFYSNGVGRTNGPLIEECKSCDGTGIIYSM